MNFTFDELDVSWSAQSQDTGLAWQIAIHPNGFFVTSCDGHPQGSRTCRTFFDAVIFCETIDRQICDDSAANLEAVGT